MSNPLTLLDEVRAVLRFTDLDISGSDFDRKASDKRFLKFLNNFVTSQFNVFLSRGDGGDRAGTMIHSVLWTEY